MSLQNKISIPCLNEKPINKEELEKYWTRMKKTLDQIEQIWLDNGKKNYIAGDKISVADIVAVCELEQPLIAGLVHEIIWGKTLSFNLSLLLLSQV